MNDYKDFSTSAATLLQYILGTFSYDELADARPLIAWIFFGLYVTVVNIVVINLIIAIGMFFVIDYCTLRLHTMTACASTKHHS